MEELLKRILEENGQILSEIGVINKQITALQTQITDARTTAILFETATKQDLDVLKEQQQIVIGYGESISKLLTEGNAALDENITEQTVLAVSVHDHEKRIAELEKKVC